jgi:hypothetical protein
MEAQQLIMRRHEWLDNIKPDIEGDDKSALDMPAWAMNLI